MIYANPHIDKLNDESTLARMLENRAVDVPDSQALLFRGKSWTYRELNETADRMATALLGLGVTPEDRIINRKRKCWPEVTASVVTFFSLPEMERYPPDDERSRYWGNESFPPYPRRQAELRKT